MNRTRNAALSGIRAGFFDEFLNALLELGGLRRAQLGLELPVVIEQESQFIVEGLDLFSAAAGSSAYFSWMSADRAVNSTYLLSSIFGAGAAGFGAASSAAASSCICSSIAVGSADDCFLHAGAKRKSPRARPASPIIAVDFDKLLIARFLPSPDTTGIMMEYPLRALMSRGGRGGRVP